MRIGLITASMSIPKARLLKDRRSVLRSLKDRMMNVSVAEVGRRDGWKFSELAIVTVSAESKIMQLHVSDVERMLRSNLRIVLTNISTEML